MELFAGRYEVKEVLGPGTEPVHRAYDRNLQIDVALKRFMTYRGASGVAFEEAQKLKRLEGPHILRVHNADVADDIPYMASAIAGAGSAERHCVPHGVPAARALLWTSHLLSGLDSCHRVGLVHRDVKPGNLFLDSLETALLGDFGVVKSVSSDGTVPVGGDPRVIAPEMWGEGRGDARSDVYSTGVTLWRLLTGSWPFPHEESLALDAYGDMVCRGLPFRLRDVAPHLPGVLARVVERALARDPAGRYQTAQEMQVALSRLELPTRSWQRNPPHGGHDACWVSSGTRTAVVQVCTSEADGLVQIEVTKLPAGSRVRAHCRSVRLSRRGVELRGTFDALTQ